MPAQPDLASVFELIVANPGISDREIAETFFGVGAAGASVNALCRELAEQRRTVRRLRPDTLFGNWPADRRSSSTSR
jgi:hypothetical protein